MYQEVHASEIEAYVTDADAAALLTLFRGMAEDDGRAPFSALLRRISGELGPSIAVLRPYGKDDFLYSQYGSAIVTASGIDLTGHLVSETPSQPDGFLRDIYVRVMATRKPLLAVHRSSPGDHVHLWERLVLPCRDWDGGDRLIAFLRPRQMRADMLGAILEASQDGIMAMQMLRDRSGAVADAVIFSANRQAAALMHLDVDDLVDHCLLSALPGSRETGMWDRYRRVVETGRTERFEVEYDQDGVHAWFRVTATPLGDGLMISMSDISDLKRALLAAERAEADLRDQAVTDALTGVTNRRGFAEALRIHTAAMRRYGDPLCLVAVDLDHFKAINDQYGHAAGDAVLTAAAGVFREQTRLDIDVIARTGGEEFVILMPRTTLEGAFNLAERIRLRLGANYVQFADERLRVTASFGIRELASGADPEQALAEADAALYEAKRAGRNRVVAWTPGMRIDRGTRAASAA
jgi:diguanylate cyclase (GGDEF)-like protein